MQILKCKIISEIRLTHYLKEELKFVVEFSSNDRKMVKEILEQGIG